MNLFKDLERVYDANVHKAGIIENRNTVLFPIFHCGQSVPVTITIDMDGNFVSASINDPEKEFTVIPCTLDSSCRTNNTAPHPCNDRVDYLSGNMAEYYDFTSAEKKKNERRHHAYLALLKDWAESPYAVPKIQAIYDYIQQDILLGDLAKGNILEFDESGHVNPKQKINKTAITAFGIRFSVVPVGGASEDDIPETWLDTEMFRSFIEYYTTVSERELPKDYCFVNGELVSVTDKHSNGIRTNADFAKLISSNKNGLINFSRERFHTASEAMSVGYITSLKFHNALRWLISLQGVRNGENITLAWTNDGMPLRIPYNADTPNVYGDNAYAIFPNSTTYKENLDNIASAMSAEDESNIIHFLELDSSFKGDFKGRIAILNYQIFTANDYYDKVLSWHKKNFWTMHLGKRHFTGSPSVRDIVLAAYGIEGSNNMLTVNAQSMYSMLYNRIVKCIISGYELPSDILKQLYYHASSPMRYSHNRERIWSIACAMINGTKGGGEIMLDTESNDRNYLFGRLLAIANYAERLTFKESEDGRETNAIRYMSDFATKPMDTWGYIFKKLQPYLKKLNREGGSGEFYRRLINQIMDSFGTDGFNNDELNAHYLLGFSSQMNYFNKRDYARKMAKENADTASANAVSTNDEN